MTNIQGVDLNTGKLLIPFTLTTLAGPNGFGESFGIQYSNLGLLSIIKTWNQDAPTSILGLGWSLTIPRITRIGNGSIYDTFLLNEQKLIPISITDDTNNLGFKILKFVTAVKTLQDITYSTYDNSWTVKDADATVYVYGGSTRTDAIMWGVNWLSQDNQTPAIWVGPSVETGAQNQYALVWNLASKTNVYGQQVNYYYNKRCLNVGTSGTGLTYDVASYLSGISVVNGQALKLFYNQKQNSEYPPLRCNYEADGSITNAYQDCIETQYLASAQIYDELNQLQTTITFNYGTLWQNNSNWSTNANCPLIDKRLLLSIATTTPDNYAIVPTQEFDYWGYSGPTNDGYNNTSFPVSGNILQLTDADLDGSSFGLQPYVDMAENSFNPLFGHLKSIKSPTGAMTWYSYAEVSNNYNSIPANYAGSWGNFNGNWQANQLALTGINYPDGKTGAASSWDTPRVYWGPDNYVVLTWYSASEIDSNYNIWIEIYEWLGSWQKIFIQNLGALVNNIQVPVFTCDQNPYQDYNLISVGQGCFVFLRDNYADPNGAIAIFTRNPLLPGQWNVAWFEPNQIIGSPYVLADDVPGYNPLITISNNIIAITDPVYGYFYAYGWNGTSWDELGRTYVGEIYSGSPIESDQIGFLTSSALGNTAFVLYGPALYSSNMPNSQYWLYTYNPQQTQNPWSITQNGNLPFQIIDDSNNSSHSSNGIESIQTFICNGFILVVPTLEGADYYFKPFIVSWNDAYTVNFQQIYNAGNWQFEKGSPWPWEGLGNLVGCGNNIYFTAYDTKLALSYTGSTGADGNNSLGWYTYSTESNLSNSDPLSNLPMLDCTFSASGHSTVVNQFYQYTPTPAIKWQLQNSVSNNLPSYTDTALIINIISFGVQVANVFMMFLGPIASIFGRLAILLRVADIAMSPVASFTGWLAGKVAASVFSDAVSTASKAVTGFIAGQAENIGQNYLMNYILKLTNNGYVNEGLGSYLIQGAQYGTVYTYYKTWTANPPPTYSAYQWTQINTSSPNGVLYPVDYDSVISQGPSNNAFFMGNGFIAYDYAIETQAHVPKYYLSTGQITFFNNGIAQCTVPTAQVPIPGQYYTEYSDFAAYTLNGGQFSESNNLCYQLGSIEPYDSDFGLPPTLTAPWGGIIGFLGEYYDTSAGHYHYQWDFHNALTFGLMMARNNAIQGNVTDYIINKVSVEDGYQTYNAYFQFMPQQAVFDRAINSIRYNQVRVAQGAGNYIASAQQFGWSEYYFYNGGIYYAGSPYGELLFDPATPQGNSAFNKANANQTNAGKYYSLMTGQLYCQRTLLSKNNDIATGFEVARQQIFYKGFSLNPCDTAGNPSSRQQTVGVVPTLTMQCTAPNTTVFQDIDDAIDNSVATLIYSYTFYDLVGAYGTWWPSNIDSDFYAWLDVNTKAGLNTSLPLGKLTYNYKLINNVTTLEAIYTQSLPGFLGNIPYLHKGTAYATFADLNWFMPLVQNITWQCSLPMSTAATLAPPPLNENFPVPATTWGNSNWQIVSSDVTTWQTFTTETNAAVWYPSSNYKWQGNLDGSALTQQLYFPWNTPPSNQTANTVWVQGDSTVEITGNGILLTTQSNIGTPTTSVYDQQYFKNIASFTNAGLTKGVAFYLGFEVFENLTDWTLNELPLSASNFSSLSYTGNRSLLVSAAAGLDNNTYALTLVYNPALTINDVRNWLLSLTLCSTSNIAVGIALIANDSSESTILANNQAINLSNSWSTINLPLANFSSLANIEIINLMLLINFPEINDNDTDILIDNIYFTPTTQAGFAINAYDSVHSNIMSNASLNDRNFTTRYLFDNLQRPIGNLRKNVSNPQQIDVVQLNNYYFSRNGYNNGDVFSIADPNNLFTATAGLNTSAGYYFDFRDGQNPWNAGVVQDRLLLLNINEVANFQLPTTNTYGFGIQVQMQGYVENYSTTLSSGVVLGLPSATTAYGGKVWGCYASSANTPTDIYMFSLTDAGVITLSASPSVNNCIPVYAANGQLLIADSSGAYFGVFQDNNQNCAVYNIVVDGGRSISSVTDNDLFAVSLTNFNVLYFSSTKNLYALDVNNINTGANFAAQTLVSYPADAVCSAQPAVGGFANSQLALALYSSDYNSTMIVKYYTSISNYTTLSANLSANISLPLALDEFGNVFAIDTNNILYGFDNELNPLGQVELPDSVLVQPVAGSGVVAVVLPNGQMKFYTVNLVLVAEIVVDENIIGVPFINGNRINVIGQNSNNQFSVYTYNTAGLLVTAPYISDATNSLSMTAYEEGTLILLSDGTTFTKLTLGAPSASISMGDYTVSWDAGQNQFSLSGPNISVAPVTVISTQGNWLFVLVNPVLYFYADGQQIFAITLDISTLPTGNFSIQTTNDALSCRDIVLLNDPTLATSYVDGAGKTRQLQQTAEIVN